MCRALCQCIDPLFFVLFNNILGEVIFKFLMLSLHWLNQKVYEDPFIYIVILMSTFPVTTETQSMTMLCIKKEIYDTINDDSSHDLILDFFHKIWPLLDLTALLVHLIFKTADSLVSFTSSVCSNTNLQGSEFPKCISSPQLLSVKQNVVFLLIQKNSVPNASNTYYKLSCI